MWNVTIYYKMNISKNDTIENGKIKNVSFITELIWMVVLVDCLKLRIAYWKIKKKKPKSLSNSEPVEKCAKLDYYLALR